MPLGRFLFSFAVALCAGSAAAQVADTSTWKVEFNREWHFAVSVPPGWSILQDYSIGNIRFWAKAPGSGLDDIERPHCRVDAYQQVDTAHLTQSALNDYIAAKGPPSTGELEDGMKSTGMPTRVRSSRMEWVAGVPAYVYVMDIEMQSSQKPFVQRVLSEFIYTPGRTYNAMCYASSHVGLQESARLFDANLPIFRAFLGSVLVLGM